MGTCETNVDWIVFFCITVSVKIWRLISLGTFSQISKCWCGREKSWFSRVKCCRLLQCENWSFNTWWIWNNWWDSVTSPQQGSTIVEIIWPLLLLSLRHKNLSAKSMPSTLKISLTSHSPLSHSFWTDCNSQLSEAFTEKRKPIAPMPHSYNFNCYYYAREYLNPPSHSHHSHSKILGRFSTTWLNLVMCWKEWSQRP